MGFDHLHPADSIGEIGVAVGPCVLGLAFAAAKKGYAPGNGVDSGPGGRRVVLFLATTRGTWGCHAAPIYRERGFAMSNEVYANGNEVSCKAGAGKSIAAFPDVLLHAAADAGNPAGRADPVPQHGHGERHFRRQQRG